MVLLAGARALSVSALSPGLGVLLPACSAAESSTGVEPSTDGGAAGDAQVPSSDGAPAGNDANVGADASGILPDGAPAVDSGSDGGPTRILAVHASANLFPFRICFGGPNTAKGPTGLLHLPAYPDDPAQPMPETNLPGIPVGGAVELPPIMFNGPVVPYVINVSQIEGDVSTSPDEPTCDKLFCTTQFEPDCVGLVDYAALPAVTFPPGDVVLAVTGCLPLALGDNGTSASTAQCGPNYDPAMGNLDAGAAAVAPGGSGNGTLAIAVAQLSPSFDDGGGTDLSYVDPTIDAAVSVSAPGTTSLGSLAAQSVPLSDAGFLNAYFTVTASTGAVLTEQLSSIQYFQSPASDPASYFQPNVTYFTALVGDATDAAAPLDLPDGAPNPAFDGHGLHLIAYPTAALTP